MASQLLRYMKITNNLKLIIKNLNWILISILLLSTILRLWQLGTAPPALTPDEASLGYNAYSIINTARDEHGKLLPIVFKSFGDYKPGLYVYFDIPFVAVLGLSEFSTRAPSALSGVLIVLLVYLVCYIWFDKKTAYIASFVAATNPYLIYFSRGAWEANVSLMLTLAGIYFFLKALYRPRFTVHSALCFALTVLMYQGAKLSTTIVLILLIIANWKEFWNIKSKYLFKSVVVGLIISLPIILSLFNGQAKRLTIFSVFSYPRPQEEIQIYKDGFFTLFHSNQLNYFRMVMSRWFNFYSGKFLFFAGDTANPVHTPPYQGVLLLIDFILLPLGLFNMFRSKVVNRKSLIFVFGWLILAPFSAAISRDQTNAVRSLNAAIPLVVFISYGLTSITDWISKSKYSIVLYLLLTTCYIFSIIYFLDAYFIHLPAHNSNFWRYGYREAVNYIIPIQDKYENIIFEQSFNQPYIYFLFYGVKTQPQKYNPKKWQEQSKLVDSEYKGDVGYQTKLDNINFAQTDWSQLRNAHNTLVVLSPNSIPPEILNDQNNFPIINKIKYLNKVDTAFDMIEIK